MGNGRSASGKKGKSPKSAASTGRADDNSEMDVIFSDEPPEANAPSMGGYLEVQCPHTDEDSDSEDVIERLVSAIPKSISMLENLKPLVIRYNYNKRTPPSKVAVCGSWDNWQSQTVMNRSCDNFKTIMNLEPGTHYFKFCVDDKDWFLSDLEEKVALEDGSEANFTNLEEVDYELFESLDRDVRERREELRRQYEGETEFEREHRERDTDTKRYEENSNDGFGQEFPDKKLYAKVANPPELPPHLKQVLYNHNVPQNFGPNPLPEPNHVMLNHLYALSINDGVMCIGETRRFRKKFVTTLLYKPASEEH